MKLHHTIRDMEGILRESKKRAVSNEVSKCNYPAFELDFAKDFKSRMSLKVMDRLASIPEFEEVEVPDFDECDYQHWLGYQHGLGLSQQRTK